MSTTRAFIAIDLSPMEKQSLHCIAYGLHSQFKEGRINTEDMYHVSLHFFAELPQDRIADVVKAMKKAATDQAGFTLVTGKPGIFGSDDSAVVWVGLSEGLEELSALHLKLEKLLAQAGFLEENRPYTPHITLGREINTTGFHLHVKDTELASVNLSAHALTLLESKNVNGKPVYEALAVVPFKG